MKVIEGNLSAAGQRIGIVAARFNEFITSKLLGGAEDSFLRHGGNGDNLDVAWVPGAFEIPFVAKKMARSGKYDAIVCLGAVIRGATPHFDMVANEATKGIAHVGLECDVPVIFGVLTTDSIELTEQIGFNCIKYYPLKVLPTLLWVPSLFGSQRLQRVILYTAWYKVVS